MAVTVNAEAVAALRTLGVAPDSYGPTLNTALSPGAVELVGAALAEALRPAAPDAVAIWGTADESVLAHVVASRLGVVVLRASEVEGLLGLDRAPEPDVRVGLLATRWSSQRLTALSKLITARGGQVAAVVAVLDSPALAATPAPPTATLVDAADTAEFLA